MPIDEEYSSISENLRNFIRVMLSVDPKKRPSIE